MFFVLRFPLWGLCVTSPILGIMTTLIIMMDYTITFKVGSIVHAGFSGKSKRRAVGRHIGMKGKGKGKGNEE